MFLSVFWDRFKNIFETEDPELLERAERRMDDFMESQVKAAEEKCESTVYGGKGDPGSSFRGGVGVKSNAENREMDPEESPPLPGGSVCPQPAPDPNPEVTPTDDDCEEAPPAKKSKHGDDKEKAQEAVKRYEKRKQKDKEKEGNKNKRRKEMDEQKDFPDEFFR